eukprot:9195922-Pyramimonas_sp.AAC.1
MVAIASLSVASNHLSKDFSESSLIGQRRMWHRSLVRTRVHQRLLSLQWRRHQPIGVSGRGSSVRR